MLVIFIGYIIEFTIIFLWYRFILINEIRGTNIIRRSVCIFSAQRKNIVLHFLGWGRINKDQEVAFNNIKRCLITWFIEGYLFIGYIILGPIFFKGVIFFEKNGIVAGVLYIVSLCALVLSRLKKDTQKIAKIINTYIQNIMIPLEKKSELLKIEDIERPIIKWSIKKVSIMLIWVLTITTCIILLVQIRDNKIFQVVAFALFVLTLIKDIYVNCRKTNIIVSEEIYVAGYILESVQEDIVDMCKQLRIKALTCSIIATEKVYVETKINENGIPQIDISDGFISEIYHSDARDILLITIAHELGHIYYNDIANIRKRLLISTFSCLLLEVLTMSGLIVNMTSAVFSVLMLFAFGMEVVLGGTMCDIRYWEQIAELRADRLAINVCKCNKKAFVAFWKQYSKNENKKNNNVISQFYRRYIKIEGHPSMKRRMELIEKRDKWNWWEYFEHALIILKWRMTNKGWNGI